MQLPDRTLIIAGSFFIFLIALGFLEPLAQPVVFGAQKRDSQKAVSQVLALPIFPARLQASIFGADELNFRVRNGNGWTLIAINTNLLFLERKSKQKEL